eukprot:5749040-Prymnesium_polylepis.1
MPACLPAARLHAVARQARRRFDRARHAKVGEDGRSRRARGATRRVHLAEAAHLARRRWAAGRQWYG